MAARPTWHREGCIAALQAWAAQHGQPTRNGWQVAAPDRPCAATIAYQFGSWRAGLAAAGLPAPGPGRARGSRLK